MVAYSTKLRLQKPTVGADADVWGGYLNTTVDSIDTLLNAITTTGSANAYVVSTGQTLAAYATGLSFLIKPNFTNTGAATINVDAIGAKNIYKNISGTPTAIGANDIYSGIPIRVTYDGTQFILTDLLDAALMAISQLAWSSGSPVLQWTAADTVSLTNSPLHTTIELGHASDTTLARVSAGVVSIEGATVLTGTAPQVTTIELGHASDTTLARVSAGVMSVEGSNVIMASNTGTTGHVLGYLDGVNFWSAGQSYSAGIVVTAGGMSFTQSNAGFEIGAVASSNTPFIDFHSSASSTDYDVRMIASGGNGSAGNGTLTITAATIALSVRPTFNSLTALDTGNGAQLAAANTFTQDNILASAIAPTSIYSAGYRGSPVVSGNSAYAFPAVDAESTIYHDEAGTRTYTIPANASVAHPIGTIFIISNAGNAGAAGTITLAITTDTLRRADGTSGTGSRTISANQKATIQKVTATIWEILGGFT